MTSDNTSLDNVTPAANVPAKAKALEPVTKHGWKIHLNFDPTNPNVMFAVQSQLQWLKDDFEIFDFKIGQGGGIESGQSGKEATVYVGSFDQMIKVVNLIENKMGCILLDHDPNVIDFLEIKLGIAAHTADEGHPTFGLDTWSDDVPALEGSLKYFVRYNVWPHPLFNQYGADGIPFLEETSRAAKTQSLYGGDYVFDEEAAIAEGYQKLRELYGDHFIPGDKASWFVNMRAEKRRVIADHTYEPASMEIAEQVRSANDKAAELRDSTIIGARYGQQFEQGPNPEFRGL